MARTRRPLLLPVLILFVAAGAFLYIAWRTNDLSFLRIFKPQKTSASWSILEEIRSINKLETAAYDMKVVFPYDFIGDEEVNWSYLKYQYDREPDLFLSKTDPVWHPGGRLPDDWQYAEIYSLCRQVGLDPGRPDYRFVVISVSVRAGVDLDLWIDSFSTQQPTDEVGGIEILIDENGVRTLRIKEAPVAVTSFIIEDRDSSADGFPDVPLTPGEWRQLVDGLGPKLHEMAMAGGLMESAEDGSRSFLSGIFTAAGYDHVEFTN